MATKKKYDFMGISRHSFSEVGCNLSCNISCNHRYFSSTMLEISTMNRRVIGGVLGSPFPTPWDPPQGGIPMGWPSRVAAGCTRNHLKGLRGLLGLPALETALNPKCCHYVENRGPPSLREIWRVSLTTIHPVKLHFDQLKIVVNS